MGEAKRRKASDPTYGRPKRGLIVSSPIEIKGDNLLIKNSDLDAQELRCATLLWDQILWPQNNIIDLVSNADALYLESVGFLLRPTYNFNTGGARTFLDAQIMAFNDMEARYPGLWSISQGERSLTVVGETIRAGQNPKLELISAIPVPDKDVPLAEVLEFKRKRDSELIALRTEIDSLAQAVENAGDKQQALSDQIQRIDKACADAIKVGGEWQFPVRLVDYKPTFEIRPFASLAGGVAGYLGGSAIPMIQSQSALAAVTGVAIATAPAVKLSFSGFQWRGLKPRPGPFHYVYQFHRELF